MLITFILLKTSIIEDSKFTSKLSTLKETKYLFTNDVLSEVFHLTKDCIAKIASIEHVLVTKNIVLNNIKDNTHSLGIEENMLWHFLTVKYLVSFRSQLVKGFLMIFNKVHSNKKT